MFSADPFFLMAIAGEVAGLFCFSVVTISGGPQEHLAAVECFHQFVRSFSFARESITAIYLFVESQLDKGGGLYSLFRCMYI